MLKNSRTTCWYHGATLVDTITCVYACVCLCMYMCMHMYMGVWSCVSMCVYVCMRVYLCVHVSSCIDLLTMQLDFQGKEIC